MPRWEQVPEPEPFTWRGSFFKHRVVVIPVGIGWVWIREDDRYNGWQHDWMFNRWCWFPTKRMAEWGGRQYLQTVQRRLNRKGIPLSLPTHGDYR